MSTTGPRTADEDTWEMPAAWRKLVHPRRDRPPYPAVPADGAALGRMRALLDAARGRVEEVLALPGTTPALAEHARAYLGGEPDPLGAAVAAEVAIAQGGLVELGGKAPFPDAWPAEHGLPFAACAFAELVTFTLDYRQGGLRRTWAGVRDRVPSDHVGGWWTQEWAPRHLRALLAAAGDDVYAEAVERLAARRRTSLQRLVVSYLVPTRRDWVDEVCADPAIAGLPHHHASIRWMLFCSLGSPRQADPGRFPLGYRERGLSTLATLLDGVGTGAVPLLAESLDDEHIGAAQKETVLDILAALPADEAFQVLADRIGERYVSPRVLAAARTYPARALRLLAGPARGTATDAALRMHVLTYPELVEEMLPGLPEESRAAIEEIRASVVRVPEAPAEELPPLLTAPPWTRPRGKAKPAVIKDLPSPGTRSIVWEPGERDAWLAGPHQRWPWVERLDWEVHAERFRKREQYYYEQAMFLTEAPEELVRPLVAEWQPPRMWDMDEVGRVLVARFELDVLDGALDAARQDPVDCGRLLMPYLSDEVARLMADWLVRLKQAGKTARAWFRRHGPAAAPALLPDALGKAGPARRAAENALRLIAARHGSEAVVEAARVHGDKAADAIERFLSADPLDILPPKMPVVGDWADARLLPQILLRDRAHALPAAAAEHVVTMLAMTGPGEEYAGFGVVRELCDPESLAGFGRALFQSWLTLGAPSKQGWALAQLGATGDDETVRRLTPLIRAWPGEGGHTKAVTGLDVLAAIGTDVALMHLHGIAQRVKFKGLKAKAQEKIEEVAAELELTADQLADRLVPDFGLDADGSMVLDYGPRRFTVGFDEQLKPFVMDEDGKRRKALPKPGAKDDPDLAPAAYKAFSTLKKDVRTAAADQIRRLEACMVTRRRWPVREFEELLAGHPLVRHIVRRLVWLAFDGESDGEGGGGKTTAFRVAEDGTYADVDDDVLTIADSAAVGIAHPVDLDGALDAWADVFADYEILQPFPQLGRVVHRLSDEERAAGRLTRLEGRTVPVGRILGLTSRGWRRGEPQDAGVECWISRLLPNGRYLVIELDPGIAVGVPEEFPDQTLETVALAARPEQFWIGRGEPTGSFADLDAVTASEILADLATLT
ncbi:DUF4132 domain-containing protein [Actinomadura bangladeshensis]|uniref:DUF4132 domain-containing protein n=1 Tax=Actinomadura bangladeshensis TaxID=453573 RepID=A0A4R4P4X5_9ACTN|nr:DUF4132 domain-containing protein [Actinomadura bangladeshensis]TDC15843.1 DUF4132 domain-containing protein [Actinomadura bangladeshensis]